jgi:tetratricopeptide (TPR) repeat protein
VIIVSQKDSEEFHRETAKKCFNEAWDYLDKKNRTSNDDRVMLKLAHTAAYHRSFAGSEKQFAVGDWQISRVYAALNEPRLALSFARSALERMEKNALSDILSTGYEAMARAHAVAKEFQVANDYIKRATEQLAKAKVDDEDRKIYSDQIQETERLIDSNSPK